MWPTARPDSVALQDFLVLLKLYLKAILWVYYDSAAFIMYVITILCYRLSWAVLKTLVEEHAPVPVGR